ncbi:DUF4124 domain-containing protein [Glaciecola siphonariae]|uniref:DUF4124 domain-containing protein n=1 Tax=Glaciecola siphonariae TaxID=521012 RepID=A0ABV9LX64_9ALTE
MRITILLALVFVMGVATAQTTIYKTVNEDGTVTFSDSPSPGAEKLEFSSPSTTIESAPVSPVNTAAQTQQQAQQQTNYRLSILSPSPGATVRNNSGDIRIASRIQPDTAGTYLLDFNGQQYSSQSGVFNLENIDRGEHAYKVLFTDGTGKVIASSEQQTLYLHQASILIRNSNN